MPNTDTSEPSKDLIFVIDDDRIQTKLLGRWLETEGYEVRIAHNGREGLNMIHDTIPSVVCLDLHMPGLDGLQVLERLKNLNPHLPVIMLTADESVEAVVRAMQLGSYDYLTKPVDRPKLQAVIKHAVKNHEMLLKLRALERVEGDGGYPEIVTDAETMERVFKQIDRLIHSDITVLIWGESGTGKELAASSMHHHGIRKGGPFVAVNCAAIPQSLQEAAFFGHEKGAFTGASERRAGFFEQANKGTLFLDEVAELTLEQQAALLRALQESRITRVGGADEIEVDVRVIAASNRRLLDEVEAGKFREDLYYRLAVYELELPPLRERDGDVMLLARHFLAEFCEAENRGGLDFGDDAINALVNHRWPGNVRELRNAIRRAVVSADDQVEVRDLPPAIRRNAPEGTPATTPNAHTTSSGASNQIPLLPLHELERRAIIAAKEHTSSNVTEMSRILGISRATLYRKFKTYGIDP